MHGVLGYRCRWYRSVSVYNLQVDLGVQEELEVRSDDVRVLVYQCVRGLLFNLFKRAGVDALGTRVYDCGQGFGPAILQRTDQDTHGLASIRERIRVLGGKVEVLSAAKKGTSITMKFPRTLTAISH